MWARLSVRNEWPTEGYLENYAVLIKLDDEGHFQIHWAPLAPEPQEANYKTSEIMKGKNEYTVYPGPRLYCLFGVMRETADGILEKLRS